VINIGDHEIIPDQIAQILGVPEVDSVIDAVGYEAHGHGHNFKNDVQSDAMDTCIDVSRFGGQLGVVGVYLQMDPHARSMAEKMGRTKFEWGRAWDKGMTIGTGQVPVKRYNRELMTAILFNRVRLTRVLNTTVIPLEEAPQAYAAFEDGVPQKFVLDPHLVLSRPTQVVEEIIGVKIGIGG
jgi:glutathione-independent formaldehyde dehydrogenase